MEDMEAKEETSGAVYSGEKEWRGVEMEVDGN